MGDKKIIAVAGATGAQGGGLVRAILDDPESGFVARAITRDPSSDKAQALAAAGAEVVAADLHDAASLKRAFEGAYGAYCVTFFWAHMSPEKEFQEAANLAGAAQHAKLHHVVWSTLEDTRKWMPLENSSYPVLLGKYTVPHFDVKAEADDLFRVTGVPTTYLLPSFYWDNFITGGLGPRPNEDGSLTLALPLADRKLAGIAADDIGRCAYGIFKEGPRLGGERIGISGDQLTGDEMAERFAKALGRPTRYVAVPFDAFRQLGFPGAEELGNMFQFYSEFEEDVNRTRSVERSRELNPELQTFDEWLERNKPKIVI